MRLNFAWNTFWKCLTTFLVPYKIIWAERQFENVLEINFIRFQLNSGWDKILKCLRIISIVCHWISPKTPFENKPTTSSVPCKWIWARRQFENVLEINFIRFQLNSGWDTIWNVLEKFQKDAIEFRLRHILEMPYNIFGTIQKNLGQESIRKRLRNKFY